jgi:AcrR family transcriptional regulator
MRTLARTATKGSEGEVRRRIPAAERRTRILKAARSAFADKGYESASLDDIAAKAKITKPVLYDHFDSKEDLYVKVLEDASEELLASLLETVRAPAPDARTRAVHAIDFLTEWISSHSDHWRLLFREPVGSRRTVRAHRDVRVRASSAIAKELLGERAGRRDPERLEMISELLAGAMHALTEWWYHHRDVQPQKLRDVAVSVLWDGLGRSAR